MLTRQLKVYQSANNHKNPCIILQGKWVNNIGFKKGEIVDIQYDHGQINILLTKEASLSMTPRSIRKV